MVDEELLSADLQPSQNSHAERKSQMKQVSFGQSNRMVGDDWVLEQMSAYCARHKRLPLVVCDIRSQIQLMALSLHPF